MEVDESDTASYKYSPLTQPDTIRLIKLRPSHDRAAMIRCDLIPSALGLVEDNIVHQYIALSYVWGDLSDRDIILVNGMALMVTRSLIRTLMLLRDDRRVLYLWIDAICINQKDNLEKEQQVQNMGRIYELAQHTVIFLGECDPVTEALIAQSLERIKLQLNVRREVQLFQALQRLLEKPWFRRVWVFQEFVLSRDPRIQFGSIRYKWAHFHSLVTHLFDKISNLDSDVDYGDVASPPFYRELAKRLPCYTTNILEKLLAVLASRRGLGVSDPRDMIFAHIGIFKGTGITPRYDRSTVHLYEEIVKYYYNLTSGLEMLHYVEDVDPNSRRKNLASWAPDWTYN
ncbi:heterokaryon incompatibility protein-domain-containing protein, partial [Tricladium varicosporioides]